MAYRTEQTNKSWITPWGKSYGATRIIHESGRRIYRLDTSSHGGYAVPRKSVEKRIPPQHRPANKNALFYFFEEDCEWAIAMFYFPEFFPEDARESMLWTLQNIYGLNENMETL